MLALRRLCSRPVASAARDPECDDGHSLGQLDLVAMLIPVNAAFAGTGMVLGFAAGCQIGRLAECGKAGRTLVRLARDPDQFWRPSRSVSRLQAATPRR